MSLQKKVSSWINNGPEVGFGTWLELFGNQVEKQPEADALIFEEETLSYAGLDQLSNWFARMVTENCSEDAPFVGVSMQRSPYMLAALIGIQKAGKGYLPLDPSFPSARLAFMASDSGIDFIFCDDSERPAAFRDLEGVVFCSALNAEPVESPDSLPAVKSSAYAYILYTSGSTGNPKGVYVSHRAFLNFLLSMKDDPGISTEDQVLGLTTISFDIAGLELFLPLICGGGIRLVREDAVYNPAALVALVQDTAVSLVQTTPSVWQLLLEAGFSGKEGLKILCGGEALSADLAAKLTKTGCDVWNMYGPTETTIWSSLCKLEPGLQVAPPIGMPINNTGLHILDEDQQPVITGEEGLLWISGDGLAEGYWHHPDLTAEVFRDGMYNTGDYVRETEDGTISFLGRRDTQIKMRGLRIDAGEIEAVLSAVEGVEETVVLPRKSPEGDTILAAFYRGEKDLQPDVLHNAVSQKLPSYMIPAVFKRLDDFPYTPNRKVDRKQFPEIEYDQVSVETPLSLHAMIRSLWERELGHKDFDDTVNFFDAGGQSIQVIRLLKHLSDFLGFAVEPLVFFQNPTISALTRAVDVEFGDNPVSSIENNMNNNESDYDEFTLAITGISCAVPGAENSEEFWDLLAAGRSGLSEYTIEELVEQGLDPALVSDTRYIRRSGPLPSTPFFDNEFFGYSPREARFMDPQQRLMLEHSWAALESAGIIPGRESGRVAVFAGCGQNKYQLKNILFSSEKNDVSDFQTMVGNSNDFLASRVAYKLDLKGPAITVQTACSTSLVAVQMGYQSLLNYQCDVALCGGISLNVPVKEGYLYSEGTILSSDGLCRPFDADASGTVFGSGIGMVVLKRLKDAVKNGDQIIALIRGAAINNDGAAKIGYTAPSVDGQAEVINDALGLAGISPDEVSYVEAHGTGTILGDPIEIAGLTKSFGNNENREHPCYIGSVKSNIGHLDAAAGIIGLIKTALSLKNRKLPPSINFTRPNPEMKIEQTPFKVNTELRRWESVNGRRIAGVSSFGIGGTNAHVVLESWEPPGRGATGADSTAARFMLCPVSAKSSESLKMYADRIADYLNTLSRTDRVNAVWTMMTRRSTLPFRGFLTVPFHEKDGQSEAVCSSRKATVKPYTIFLFPGQGTQYAGMCRSLYENNEVFAGFLDTALELVDAVNSWNSGSIIFGTDPDAETKLADTAYIQPLLFSVEWAIAKTLFSYGVQCDAMTGHSLGEFTAACLAGAFSLEDGVRLVSRRGEIMSQADEGRLLAVFAEYENIAGLIPDYVDVAGINGPGQVVLSGEPEAIENCKGFFTEKNISCKMLSSRSGFHSRLMDQILPGFEEILQTISFNPLQLDVISNLSGEKLNKGYVYTPEYWMNHLRSTVLFYQGILSIKIESESLYVEVGPGAVLSRLVRTIDTRKEKILVQTLPGSGSDINEEFFFLKGLGNIWRAGGCVDLGGINSIKNGKTLNLPTYAFKKTEHWILPDLKINNSAHNPDSQISLTQDTGDTGNKNKDVLPRLSKVWQQVLGYENISADANFFDLGGDSLMSAELVKKINAEFGITIRLNDILLNPVFQDMLDVVSQGCSDSCSEADEFPLLFPVQAKGSLPRLFLVAGAHENRYYDREKMTSSYEEDFLRYFSSLIGFLGKDQPIYGFRPRGIRFGETMHRNVETMAAVYIEELKKVQPEGPYYIGGECVGGMIAIEIARQLSAAGETVAHLVLMDTPRPGLGKFISEELFYYKQWIKKLLLRNFSKQSSCNCIKGIVHSFSELGNVLFAVTPRQKQIRQVLESSLFYQRKLLSYRPRRYTGLVTLLVNQEWDRRRKNLGWDTKIFPSMDVHVVPGNHISRLSEHGKISGEMISKILRNDIAAITERQ